MLKTHKGQTPLELAEEFQAAMNQLPVGEMLAELIEVYKDLEVNKDPSKEQDMLSRLRIGIYPLEDIPIMRKNRFQITTVAKYWLCTICQHNLEQFSCLIGMLATLFYKDHYKTEPITIAWMAEQGLVKFINYKDFFFWYLASKIEGFEEDPSAIESKSRTIYSYMEPEDYYTFGKKS